MRAAVLGWLIAGLLVAAIVAHAVDLISHRTLDHLALASLGCGAFRLMRPRGGPLLAALGAVTLFGVLAGTQVLVPGLRFMPYVLIVPANLLAAWVFASGLLPGREPVLLRLIELMALRPVDDPQFRRFVTRQCLLWAGLGVLTAGLALAAMVAVAHAPGLADLLTAAVAVQVIWFAASHHYASMRYGRPETWWTTARAMAQRETWSRLRVP